MGPVELAQVRRWKIGTCGGKCGDVPNGNGVKWMSFSG